MAFIVILVFCGLSAGAIGKIKGASFVLWFAIGFCLPLLGTLAALVSRPERDVGRRPCDECGFVLPIHVQVCGRCGADLDFPELASEPESRPDGPAPGQQQLFGA